MRAHLSSLKKYTYGKHIVARVEKLLSAGTRIQIGANKATTSTVPDLGLTGSTPAQDGSTVQTSQSCAAGEHVAEGQANSSSSSSGIDAATRQEQETADTLAPCTAGTPACLGEQEL